MHVLSEKHHALETRVTNDLKEMGFLVESAEYFKHMSDTMQAALKSNNQITTQYIRTRADRIAVHKQKGISFQVEFKTHETSQSDNMMLQALPLAIHLWNSMLGIKCLYVYSDPISKLDKGFWVDSKTMPKIRRLRFGIKRDLPKSEMMDIFGRVFPDIKKYSDGGYGHPYIVIEHEEVRKLPDWKLLVSEL